MKPVITRLPERVCPYCKELIDATVNVNDIDRDRPHPGDLSVCVYCGEISKFDDELKMNKLSPDELVYFLREFPDLNDYHKKIIKFGRTR